MELADLPLEKVSFVALDTETTGLSWRYCQLLEVGALRFGLGNESASEGFEELIDPGEPIPYAATAVHGITNEMVRGCDCVRGVMPRLMAFLARQDSVLLIHNASFDLGFLRAAADVCGMRLPETPVIDTLGLCRRLLRDMPSHKLDLLAARFCGRGSADHRAYSDACVLARIFTQMVEMHALGTWGQLMAHVRLKTLCVPAPVVRQRVRLKMSRAEASGSM